MLLDVLESCKITYSKCHRYAAVIIIIIISLIRQVGSNKRKIQIKYKIQNKQTIIKTEHANIPIKNSKLKKIY